MAREIALLTNPTSGKGAARAPRRSRCRGCGRPASHVRSLVGRDADEALDLARAVRRRRRRERWSWCGGDGMVHLARAGAGRHRRPRSGSSRPAPATTWPATSTCPRSDPQRGRRRGGRPRTRARSTWPAVGSHVLRDRAGRRLRRHRQRARQRDDLAARARCATTSPPSPSCGSSSRCPTPSSSTATQHRLEAMLVAVGNGPSFGGGLRITEGAVARRRPARRGDHQADEQARSWSAPTPSCSRAPTSRTRSTSTTGSRSVTVAAPGIVAYADGERLGAAAADRRRRARWRCRCWCPDERMTRPAERTPRFRREQRAPGASPTSPQLYDFALDDFQVRACQRARGRPRRAGRRADRLRQDDRRRVRRAPGAATGPQVLLHDADQGAVEPEVQRPRRALRRRPGRPAHRRQHDQRRGAGRGDDHRGAPQHAVRRLRAR